VALMGLPLPPVHQRGALSGAVNRGRAANPCSARRARPRSGHCDWSDGQACAPV